FWFNPFVWLFRKEVEKNIEYQTDDLLTRKAVKKEKKGYQLNLLKIATHNKPLTITTNYNQSLIKQRILKMNAKKSNPYSYWKYAFIAPVLLMLILAMNEPYQEFNLTSNEAKETLKDVPENKDAIASDATAANNLEELHKIVEALRKKLKSDQIVSVDDIIFEYQGGKIEVNDRELSEQQTQQYLQFLEERGFNIVGDKFSLHILPEKEHWRVSGKIEFNDSNENNDFNALMQAIKDDDLRAVKTYLEKDINLNQKDQDGFTPLLLAAHEQHDAVAKAIVAHITNQVTAQVDLQRDKKWTASDLSSVDHKDFELFMRAVDDGDLELVMYFLDKGGIDVNGIGRNEFTPLMLAASEDHPEVVHLLIDRGAKINFMNSNGWTALIEAADEGSYASALVLIEAGADIDLHEKEGGRSAVVMAASEGHLNLLELLLESGADFSNYHDGYTPLHGAAEEGQTEIMKILLKKIDANFTDHYQRTPLFYAAEEGHVDIVKYLVAKGAKINIQARNGRTPLSYAAEERQQAIVQFLLEKGADASVRDEEGFTALDYAIDEAAEEVINILLKTDSGAAIIKANNSALLEAIEEGLLATVRSLLEAGADVNGANRNGWTPLMEAADESNLEIAQFLVAKGANVNAASNIGWTALIEAVDEKSLKMVRYLIEAGADVNAATTREFREGVGGRKHYIVHAGWTPLFEAIDEGAVLAADLLFKQGADVNASISRTLVDQDNGTRSRYDNWTLLMDAVERERMEMIEFLLKSGADVKAKNSLGETALDVAKKTGNQLVVKMIRKG
ncbi:MAG: ankyrin repeat domain-containing protein, partial [Bacteroidota bacterium]